MSGLKRISRRDDHFVVVLFEQEIQVLRWVLDDLTRAMRGEGGNDAVHERLFPRAYLDPTEEAAERDWQSLVHDDLVESRAAAVAGVRHALDDATRVRREPDAREVVLDDEALASWIGVVNDARLAIGTALGVTADSDLAAVDPGSPTFEIWVVYDWLTGLLASLLGRDRENDSEDDDEEGGDGAGDGRGEHGNAPGMGPFGGS